MERRKRDTFSAIDGASGVEGTITGAGAGIAPGTVGSMDLAPVLAPVFTP